MNIFQLVLKQMRQRALSTYLTLLSVLLGVALAIAIMIAQRETRAIFGQTDYGFDILVGAKGSALQLVMNTVYQVGQSQGTVSYAMYEELTRNPLYARHVRTAVPIEVGDSYKNQRIVGTSPKIFGVEDDGVTPIKPDRVFQYRPDQKFTIAQGKIFSANRFEAVIGSDMQRLTGLKLGDVFHVTHGMPAPNQTPDVHEESWTVVGVLDRTGTAYDRVAFVPLFSLYCIKEHGDGMESMARVREGLSPNAPTPTTQHEEEEPHHYTTNPDGSFALTLPKEDWVLSAILVKSWGTGYSVGSLQYITANRPEAMAVNPATTMREFFGIFLNPISAILLGITALVSIVAAVSILVSIYNSVSARGREIAIMRALGATQTRILSIICLEALVIGIVGGVLGWLLGHGLGAVGSAILAGRIGEGINWYRVDRYEFYYLGAVAVVSVLAGLVPALKAYSTPVARNLTSS